MKAKKNKRPTARPGVTPSPVTEFNPDYTQVRKDLGRIGLLAGSFFILLIALSFVIK